MRLQTRPLSHNFGWIFEPFLFCLVFEFYNLQSLCSVHIVIILFKFKFYMNLIYRFPLGSLSDSKMWENIP